MKTQSSNKIPNEDFLKTLIFALVLMLFIAFILFFAVNCKSDKEEPLDAGTSESTAKSTTAEPKNDTPVIEPVKYPYATVTSKKSFTANGFDGTKNINLSLYSKNAVLIDINNMTVLARKDADELIYPASMTKIMTAVVACDLITDLDDRYIVTQEILNKVPSGASNAWLKKGQSVSVRDLLYGVTYLSGADSVICLIDYLGLSESEFVSLMNKKAKEIGLSKTTFGGAIGMDTENNQTTCREMAAIMTYAMENPLCQKLFGGSNTHDASSIGYTYYHSTLITTLKELGARPDTLVDGYTVRAAKSGYEDKALHCLASYIESSDGGKFILITAGAEKTMNGSDVISSGKANAVKDLITILKNYGH